LNSSSSLSGSSWEIIPTNSLFGALLFILILYFFFRHVLFVLMVMDVVNEWLRQFAWFPREGKRTKTFVHWIVALVLIICFLVAGTQIGWFQIIPK